MDYKEIRLGDYIQEYDEINSNQEFTNIEDLQGINSNKYFQECKSNKNDIDLYRYRICRQGMFSYNRATSRNGEKISIAYRTGPDCLVSPSYYCFSITDKNVLLPEFLMLHFKKSTFDKYVRFNSWGSATEFFTFQDMCETKIKIPGIEEQKKIVNQYKLISNRINILQKINEKLQDLAFIKYKKVITSVDKKTTLSNIADITMGASPEGECLNEIGDGVIFYQGKTDFGFRYPEPRCFTTDSKKMAKKGDVLMSVRAPVGDINIANTDCSIGRGIASIRSKDKNSSFLFYTMRELYFELNQFNSEGTVFGSINKDELFSLKVAKPEKEIIEKFERQISKIDLIIMHNEKELSILRKMRNLIIR